MAERDTKPQAGCTQTVASAWKELSAALALWPSYLNFDTRSACSRMTRALSLISVPVGSPLYNILGLDQ